MGAENLKEKIFCIGLAKTGTTSMETALGELGYKMGDQFAGEMLLEDWRERKFEKLLDLCYSAEAFQDIPFCLPYTFQFLHGHFPNAKFILTRRNNAAQWYRSYTESEQKLWSSTDDLPSKEDLENVPYIRKGWAFRCHKILYATPNDDLYNRDYFINYYNRHLANVREFFRRGPENLIDINVSVPADYKRLCEFLGKLPKRDRFPWDNKTKDEKQFGQGNMKNWKPKGPKK